MNRSRALGKESSAIYVRFRKLARSWAAIYEQSPACTHTPACKYAACHQTTIKLNKGSIFSLMVFGDVSNDSVCKCGCGRRDAHARTRARLTVYVLRIVISLTTRCTAHLNCAFVSWMTIFKRQTTISGQPLFSYSAYKIIKLFIWRSELKHRIREQNYTVCTDKSIARQPRCPRFNRLSHELVVTSRRVAVRVRKTPKARKNVKVCFVRYRCCGQVLQLCKIHS